MQYGVCTARCFATNANANASASQWTQEQANSRSYQTLIKHSTVHQKRVEYADSLLKRVRVFIE